METTEGSLGELFGINGRQVEAIERGLCQSGRRLRVEGAAVVGIVKVLPQFPEILLIVGDGASDFIHLLWEVGGPVTGPLSVNRELALSGALDVAVKGTTLDMDAHKHRSVFED